MQAATFISPKGLLSNNFFCLFLFDKWAEKSLIIARHQTKAEQVPFSYAILRSRQACKYKCVPLPCAPGDDELALPVFLLL